MKNRKKLTRNVIVQTLIKALKPLDYVHAFYEGGAIAFNRIDRWSDIDLMAIADKDRITETFQTTEKALESLSPIKQKFSPAQLPWPEVSQTFYFLEKADEYLFVDFAVLTPSAPEKFLQPKIHGAVKFYFNKIKVKPPPLNKEEFIKKLQAESDRLQARLTLFNNMVQKEINRGNSLEAVYLYYAFTLASLVKALRIKHNPVRYDFGMRYVHYELPPETIKQLERLYFVKDMKDLQQKYREATRWFQETIATINEDEIARSLRKS
jgi:hypothetical protein